MSGVEKLHRSIRLLNDEHGRGGKARLAKLLEWDYSTLWRKLNGKSSTTRADVLAAQAAASMAAPDGGGAV